MQPEAAAVETFGTFTYSCAVNSVDLHLLVIGGGVHGTFLSHALTRQTGIDRAGVRVLDPFSEPLHYWRQYTGTIGMRFLRSPSSHNMDVDFRALRRWARTRSDGDPSEFIEPYARPSLELFDKHTDFVIRENGLQMLRLKGRAMAIDIKPGGVVVTFENDGTRERISARNVLIAIGRSEQLNVPSWAEILAKRGAPISHIFGGSHAGAAGQFRRGEIVVVGGGITSAQFALAMHRKTNRQIVLVSRHESRIRMFDSNPCFIGPKCLSAFRTQPDYSSRRELIVRHRYPGSMPPYVAEELSDAVRTGAIRRIAGELTGAELTDGCIRMAIREFSPSAKKTIVESERVYLATGFRTERPGGRLIDDSISRFKLPIATCGFPIVDANLRWAPGVYVAGPLAELELGPASLNIIGAHNAAKLLAPVLRAQ